MDANTSMIKKLAIVSTHQNERQTQINVLHTINFLPTNVHQTEINRNKHQNYA